MSGLIIDASVAIKWVVEEEGTDEALALRRQKLFAPDLIISECANILWKKVRRNELTADEAALAARLLANANIELAPTAPLLDAALEIALFLEHPAYDCMYLALAERNALKLVTADTRLINRARATERFRESLIDLAPHPIRQG